MHTFCPSCPHKYTYLPADAYTSERKKEGSEGERGTANVPVLVVGRAERVGEHVLWVEEYRLMLCICTGFTADGEYLWSLVELVICIHVEEGKEQDKGAVSVIYLADPGSTSRGAASLFQRCIRALITAELPSCARRAVFGCMNCAGRRCRQKEDRSICSAPDKRSAHALCPLSKPHQVSRSVEPTRQQSLGVLAAR